MAWKQGADDLMKALKIDIEYIGKYNELNDQATRNL